MQILKRLFSEPLFHFLLIGAILYVYFDVTQKNPALAKKQQITLLEYDASKLATQNGLHDKKLLLDYLKYKEAMLTDAYALKLYKDDKTIQHILLQKREFILNATAKVKEPNEKELKKYYEKHPKDFSTLLHFDVTIKQFNSNVSKKLIKKLTIFSDLKKADKLSTLKNSDLDSISKKFGKYIALKIATTPQNYWSIPISMQNKTYVFYVTNKKTGKLKAFESVESEVYTQYMHTKTLKARQKAYQQLLKNYTFKVVQ